MQKPKMVLFWFLSSFFLPHYLIFFAVVVVLAGSHSHVAQKHSFMEVVAHKSVEPWTRTTYCDVGKLFSLSPESAAVHPRKKDKESKRTFFFVFVDGANGALFCCKIHFRVRVRQAIRAASVFLFFVCLPLFMFPFFWTMCPAYAVRCRSETLK